MHGPRHAQREIFVQLHQCEVPPHRVKIGQLISVPGVLASTRRTAMSRSVTCTCGYVVRANSDEEMYSLVRRHIIPMDRELHQPVLRKPGEKASTRSLRSMQKVRAGRA
jgi:hypothetical protein